jgi:hypothetical protein
MKLLIFCRSDDYLQQHMELVHPPNNNFKVRTTALRRSAVTLTKTFNSVKSVGELQNDEFRSEIKNVVVTMLGKFPAYKVSLIVIGQFTNETVDPDGNFNNIYMKIPLRSTAHLVTRKTMLKKVCANMLNEVDGRVDEINHEGSGFTIASVIATDLEFTKVKSLTGGCGINFNINNIPNSKYLCNVKNNDNRCLLYAIASSLSYQKSKKFTPDRSHHIESPKRYDSDIAMWAKGNMSFPSTIGDIIKFVNNNKYLDIKINVLGYIQEELYPVKLNIGNGSTIINLIQVDMPNIENDAGNDHLKCLSDSHYMSISNISKFLKSRYGYVNKDNISAYAYKEHLWCLTCFSHFQSEDKLKLHSGYCKNKGCQVEQLPDENGDHYVRFKSLRKNFLAPINIFYDLEACLQPTDVRCGCGNLTCKCLNTEITQETAEHIPIVFAYIIVDVNGNLLKEKSCFTTTRNAAALLMRSLLNTEEYLREEIEKNVPMEKLTKDQNKKLYAETECFYCGDEMAEDDRVRDHDHYTGKI